MSGSMMQQYPPGDPQMIDTIVHQLKSQGIFDQFRKECIADVDTKPAYQNLHQRVESTVSGFLAHQVWRPDLNKNQLRESLRKHIHDSGFLNLGVERIVDQVVNPKINSVLVPQVEDVVYEFIGLEKPKRRLPDFLHHPPPPLFGFHVDQQPPLADKRKDVSLTDLLPKGLDPISPDSDETKKSYDSVEDGELDEGKACDDEASPPFEHIAHVNDNSVGSHLSGISGLTSPDGRHSSISFVDDKTLIMEAMPFDGNNDSQLSKVSSGSRLSISFDELDKPAERPACQVGLSRTEETRMSVDSNDPAIANEQVRHSAQIVESDSSKTSDDLPSDARRESLESATFSDDSSCSAPEYETREDYSPLNSDVEHEELLFTPVGKAVEIRDTEELTVEGEEVGQKTKRAWDEISVKYEMEDKKLTKKVKEDKRSDKYQEYDALAVKTDREKSVKNEIEIGLLKSSKKDFNTTKELENVKKEKKEVKGSKGLEEKERKVEKDLKVKAEEKEHFKKKDDSVSLKKIEKGKEIKKHDKPKVEKSIKKEEKDKKPVKSEEKPVKKDEKDKSEKKDDKEQKSSKRDEKHKPEHENGSLESKRRDSSSHSAHRPKSDKDKHHQSSSKPRTHVEGEKSSKPRGHEDGGKSSKPRSHDDGDKSSKPRSHDDGDKSSKPHSHEDGGKSNKPHSHEDGGKSSKPHSHEDSGKSSKPHSHEDGGKSSKPHSHEDGGKSSKPRSHEDGGKSSKPHSHEDSGKSSKPRRPSHEEGEKSSKSDKHATKDDKVKRDEKHKSKNGKVDKEKPSKSDDKTPKDKDRPAKERDVAPRKGDGGGSGSVKSDRERKDSKSKGPPGDKGKDGKRRDKGGKPTDDHDKHREKRSEDRRSTDRDSNGTTRDATPGSSRPAAAGGGTATSSRQHESKDDKNKGGKTRNDGGGNADATGTKNEASESGGHRKRATTEELREEYFCTDNDGKLTLKIKKPKIAANIFEVQRIIRMRKSLSKMEERRQKELCAVQELLDSAVHADESRADEAPSRITEGQSQGSEVHGQAAERQPAPKEAIPSTRSVDRSLRVSESDGTASEDLRGFEETYFAANQSFVDFVKRIGASRELCDIDASSVSTDDLEYLSDSEVLDISRDYSHARLPYPDVVLSTGPAGRTEALHRMAAAPAPALVRVEVVSKASPVPAPATPHSLPNPANTPQAVADRGSSKEMLPPARRARKPNVRYSSEDYSFEADGEELDRKPASATTKRPAVQGKTAAAKKPKFCSPHAAGVLSQLRQGVGGDSHTALVAAGKLKSQVNQGIGEDSHNAGNLVSLSNAGVPEANHNGLPEASARLNGTEAVTGNAREQRGGSASPPARLALGPSRRVGLTRPPAAPVTRVAVLELSRVATPTNADFVMPLSPESDVSASSGEQGAAKKGAVTPPLPPKAEGEGIATAGKRNQRSAASKAQRYSSDDLYKPRPLFNRPTRRARGSSPGVDPETVSDCVVQRDAVTVDSQPQIPKQQR